MKEIYATLFLIAVFLFPIWGPIVGLFIYLRHRKRNKTEKEEEFIKSLNTRTSNTNKNYEEWVKTQRKKGPDSGEYHSVKPQIEFIGKRFEEITPHDQPETNKQREIMNHETVQGEYKTITRQIEIIESDVRANSNPEQNPRKTINEPPYEVIPYEAIPLLTLNEKRNYLALRDAAERKRLWICPKIRLADLIKPYNDKEYMKHFGKIKSKHVDFVICDREMNVRLIIELDDNSHYQKDRMERDEFVDKILTATGYKIIHTRHITPDILDNI